MRPSFPLLNTETQKYGLLGVLFGLTFPVIATLIRIQDANLSFSLQTAWSVQRQDTLLWIIDTAPLFLGLFAALAGWRQDAAQKTYAELQTRERELREVYVTLEQRVRWRRRCPRR